MNTLHAKTHWAGRGTALAVLLVGALTTPAAFAQQRHVLELEGPSVVRPNEELTLRARLWRNGSPAANQPVQLYWRAPDAEARDVRRWQPSRSGRTDSNGWVTLRFSGHRSPRIGPTLEFGAKSVADVRSRVLSVRIAR